MWKHLLYLKFEPFGWITVIHILHSPNSLVCISAETAVCLDANISVRSNLYRLSRRAPPPVSLSCSISLPLQEISCQNKEPRWPLTPSVFRRLRKTDWCYQSVRLRWGSSLLSALKRWWFIKRMQLRRQSSEMLTPAEIFRNLFVFDAFRPDSNANPIFAELWRGRPVQGDRGGVPSSGEGGEREASNYSARSFS